jgi:hypothetical protein
MKTNIWILSTDDDHSGHQGELYGTEEAASAAAVRIVETMAKQNKLTADVTPDNWQEVLSQFKERPGFNDFVWLDCREVELSDLGPIAITLEGGTVQDVVTDDKRLCGIDVMVIDYDTDGADETYDVPQKSRNGEITEIATACLSDRAISAASGIELSEVWRRFSLACAADECEAAV